MPLMEMEEDKKKIDYMLTGQSCARECAKDPQYNGATILTNGKGCWCNKGMTGSLANNINKNTDFATCKFGDKNISAKRNIQQIVKRDLEIKNRLFEMRAAKKKGMEQVSKEEDNLINEALETTTAITEDYLNNKFSKLLSSQSKLNPEVAKFGEAAGRTVISHLGSKGREFVRSKYGGNDDGKRRHNFRF